MFLLSTVEIRGAGLSFCERLASLGSTTAALEREKRERERKRKTEPRPWRLGDFERVLTPAAEKRTTA